MSNRIHTRTKIFFPNPYVVRVEYDSSTSMDDANSKFRNLTRQTYRLIKGTWGYSKLEFEDITPAQGNSNIAQPFNLQMLFTQHEYVPRAYFCFREEIDVLQFRLSIDTSSKQVNMWPERLFTIHEFIED